MTAALIRLAIFAGLLPLLAWLEWRRPRRPLELSRARRWPAHAGLQLIDALLLRLAFPLAAAGFALQAQAGGLGLCHWLGLPAPLAWAVSLPALDLALYAQHRASHRVGWLWRLHRVHHGDTSLDVTTALRFHPLEILLSMAWKGAVIMALGAPPGAVLVFEVLLNATALFNHANLDIPPRADRWLRRLLVTPDMHRVHHSVHRDERDSNYGFCLPLWDHLFGSYRAQPRDGHLAMRLGLPGMPATVAGRLSRLLLWPLAPLSPADR